MSRALLALLLALVLAPAAYATGGWYDGVGAFHAADEENPCGREGITAVRSGGTGIVMGQDGVEHGVAIIVYTCGDGREVQLEWDLGPLAEYVPDPPAAPTSPPCVDGFYDDEGWHEQVCP